MMSYISNLFKFRLEGDASCNYIVIEPVEGAIKSLQLQMFELNPNPNVLPFAYRVKNNVVSIYYNVTSEITLKQYLTKKVLKRSIFIDMLLTIIKVITDSKNYYAEDKNFAMDENLIYINPTTKNLKMMYIPVDFEVDFKSEFKEFIRRIIDNLVQIEEANEIGFLKYIIMYMREDTFNLNELHTILNNFKTESNPYKHEELNESNYKNPSVERIIKEEKEISSPVLIKNEINKSFEVPKSLSEAKLTQTSKPRQKKNMVVMKIAILQALVLVLFTIIYIAFISRRADKTGTLGGTLIILGAINFLVIKNLLNNSREKTFDASLEEDHKRENSLIPPKQKRREISINKIENTSLPPMFNKISPYDCGNTMVLSESDRDNVPKIKAFLVNSKEGSTQKIIINSSNFIIGRMPEQSDYIIDNKNISKLHAAIINRNGKYYIRDLKTTNGTFVNSKKMDAGSECEIKDKDKIKLALLEFDFIVS